MMSAPKIVVNPVAITFGENGINVNGNEAYNHPDNDGLYQHPSGIDTAYHVDAESFQESKSKVYDEIIRKGHKLLVNDEKSIIFNIGGRNNPVRGIFLI